MPRVMVVTGTPALRKGTVVELSAAEIVALGSAVRSVVYRDTLGEGTAVSNSSA